MSFQLFPTDVPLNKRLFDLFICVIGLVIISPILILISLAVILFIGFPILFVQTRPGLHGKLFNLYKFRSMSGETHKNGNVLSEGERLTPLGRFLRHTSLDELPELFNILKGEMSLVGPRPLLVEYLPLYSREQARRHEVIPGITGWAQVNGRNALTWDERFKLDVWYVNHRTFCLDLRIIFITIWKVIKGEGISPVMGEIMGKFTGKK